MSVRALDKNNDWTFGRNKANYIKNSDALNQKVSTRLQSWKNDNPLFMSSNIDWRELLGNKGTEDTILKEIERVTLQTSGVTKVTSLEIVKTIDRIQSIALTYDTVYTSSNSVEILEL